VHVNIESVEIGGFRLRTRSIARFSKCRIGTSFFGSYSEAYFDRCDIYNILYTKPQVTNEVNIVDIRNSYIHRIEGGNKSVQLNAVNCVVGFLRDLPNGTFINTIEFVNNSAGNTCGPGKVSR